MDVRLNECLFACIYVMYVYACGYRCVCVLKYIYVVMCVYPSICTYVHMHVLYYIYFFGW